jgi:KipI family sensor histidine kinase inhibitor
MKLLDVGDRGVAVVVEAATPDERLARVRGLTKAIHDAATAGVTDVVPSPGRVTVVYDPLLTELAAVRRAIEEAGLGGAAAMASEPAARHELPVCYGGDFGPDLEEVCGIHGIDRERLVHLHTGADYTVEAIGFLPGFAYLAGLPPALVTPRRATPRRVVPAGSVGIGGGQTGAYPFASPGGWNLIGHTPTRLFDPARRRPAVWAVGDRVRFVSIDHGQHASLQAAATVEPPSASLRAGGITVLEPGLFTTIQDLGRPGYRASGVPLSGAADPVSLRLANRLVGNADGMACLEITLLGPALSFSRPATIALTGAVFPGIPSGRAVAVAAGETLRLGHAVAGCRGYLAVAGGLAVPDVLGSASTIVPARLGGLRGLPLAAGDVVPLAAGDAGPPGACEAGPRAGGRDGPDAVVTLRMIPGEQFSWGGDRLWEATHRVSSRSDRMGLRLEGTPLPLHEPSGSLPSVAVLPGTVQLPPDGQPIVLLADAQTIGGYAVIGHVIAVDLPRVAQLRPGDRVRWQPATIAEAHRDLRAAATQWSNTE